MRRWQRAACLRRKSPRNDVLCARVVLRCVPNKRERRRAGVTANARDMKPVVFRTLKCGRERVHEAKRVYAETETTCA